MHKVERPKDDLLINLLCEKAAATQRNETKIWCPGREAPEWTDLSRYWEVGSDTFLLVNLSAEILRSDKYQTLLKSYHLERIRRLLMDLFIRWHLYREHEMRLLKQKKEWDDDWQEALDRGLNPEAHCLAKHGREVFVNISFDPKFGRIKRLRIPEPVSTLEHYDKVIPSLALNYNWWRRATEATIWEYLVSLGASRGPKSLPSEPDEKSLRAMNAEERINAIEPHVNAIEKWLNAVITVEAIQQYSWRLDTPCARILASRFVDAALRNRIPQELDSVAQKLFLDWATAVRPMLINEIQRELRRSNGGKADFPFSRQTCFYVDVKFDHAGTMTNLVLIPQVVVDQQRSVVIFDSKCSHITVLDPSDEAREWEPAKAPPGDDAIWEEFLESSKKAQSAEDMLKLLKAKLVEDPAVLMKKLLAWLLDPGESGTNSATVKQDQLTRLLESAELKNSPSWLINSIFDAYTYDASQTARAALERLKKALPAATAPRNTKSHAAVHLLAAIVECDALGMGDDLIKLELPGIIEQSRTAPNDQVEAAIAQARKADAE